MKGAAACCLRPKQGAADGILTFKKWLAENALGVPDARASDAAFEALCPHPPPCGSHLLP